MGSTNHKGDDNEHTDLIYLILDRMLKIQSWMILFYSKEMTKIIITRAIRQSIIRNSVQSQTECLESHHVFQWIHSFECMQNEKIMRMQHALMQDCGNHRQLDGCSVGCQKLAHC